MRHSRLRLIAQFGTGRRNLLTVPGLPDPSEHQCWGVPKLSHGPHPHRHAMDTLSPQCPRQRISMAGPASPSAWHDKLKVGQSAMQMPPRPSNLTVGRHGDAGRRSGTPMWGPPAYGHSASAAVHRDHQGSADLMHPRVCQAPESFDEDGKRDAFDRIKVDCRSQRYGIVPWFEKDLAGETAHRGRAGCDECSPMSRDHGIT